MKSSFLFVVIIVALLIITTTSISTICSNDERDLIYKEYLQSIKNIPVDKENNDTVSFREYIFLKNLKIIEKMNADLNQKWVAGLNEFSDLTELELRSFLGFGREDMVDLYEYVLEHQKENPEEYKKYIQQQTIYHLSQLKNAQELDLLKESKKVKKTKNNKKNNKTEKTSEPDDEKISSSENPFKKGSLFDQVYQMGEEYLEVDWKEKGKVSKIKLQGDCGSCWSFSALAAIEAANLIENDKSTDLSEQSLISCMKYGCDGGWISTTFDWIIDQKGVQYERDWPYEEKVTKCKKNDSADRFEVKSYKNISSYNMLEFLTLLATRPVTLPITATDELYKYQRGIFDQLTDIKNNHAVLAVGYKIDLKNPSNSYIKIKNSWGAKWGEEGFFRIRLSNLIKTRGILNILDNGEQIIAPYVS